MMQNVVKAFNDYPSDKLEDMWASYYNNMRSIMDAQKKWCKQWWIVRKSEIILGTEKQCFTPSNMKNFSIEKNLLIYSLDNNNKFTKKHVSYFIFSKFTPSNSK